MATELPPLKCGACGHENEPERVYCHNCGQKLDRTVLPTLEPKKEQEEHEKAHKHVEKMMSPVRGSFLRDLKTGVSVLIFAAAVAAMFLFWQTPEGVPPEKSDAIPDRDVGELWQRMMSAPNAVSVTFTEDELNHYLKRSIKAVESAVPGVKFKRTFVKLEPGLLTLTVEREMWGFGMFSSMSYSYRATADNELAVEVVGVRFGKLGLHPALKFAGEFSIGSVFKAFEKEKSNLSRLADVKVGKASITLISRPRK